MKRLFILLLGILLLMAASALTAIIIWQGSFPVEEEKPDEKDSSICIQVITRARNSLTGEEKDFPTPCDVPSGWEVIQP